MVVNVILNDSCHFGFVTVNGMDKLQLLKLITLADISTNSKTVKCLYNSYQIAGI